MGILGIKAAYVSRVSHDEVHAQAFKHGMPAGALSQIYVQRRLKFLGHILRHSSTLEYDVMFDHARNIRTLDYRVTSVRAGKPRPHWPEMAMYEANSRRLYHRDHGVVPYSQYGSPFFQIPNMPRVWQDTGGIYCFNLHMSQYTNTLFNLATTK